MRIAYLDCFAGISGDMFLGALIDAGVDPQILHTAVAALNLDASLKIERVDRSGISCTKVTILEAGKPAETTHPHEKTHDHFHEQRTHEETTHHHHPKTQHQHKAGNHHPHEEPHQHNHTHEHHDHAHGRSLTVIRQLIQSAKLAEPVKQTAIRAFELLGASEAKIHNVSIEKIHFHEVGAVDAIVDIVAASAGIHALNIQRWYCSPLNVGGGTVDCAHGRFPVPAPATADLLRDVPTYSAHIQQELVTPTGAAIIRTLSPAFGPQPAMRVQQIGYGAGTRNPKDFPNTLRISIGETEDARQSSVAVLETALDDLSPQILAHVTERAFELGALDVMSTAVQMKKGRLGTLITILADDAQVRALEELLLRETSTLGVRIHHERRSCLERTYTTVTTPYGDIRIKIGMRLGEVFNAAPEFEDCRAAAAKHAIPVKQVQQSAIAAYFTGAKN
ncbi:nickel pincer cofactor biosynthesis protein LarC [Edaphobacter flagellatus]|uniref:nickel pincer cofactor biosynthesis protein LarC n=1 Tax=Edaphobacter flagellatus TaxID=1933044 RepID=UPI0021B396F3|nr:nickel pincer cofactor biosynthesis protein LarC [Edaphobacter flagellatus]